MPDKRSPQAESPPTSPSAAILDTAFRVFGMRGYRATRLEDVAAQAGMTKGAIYYHFESKEDLLRRAVEHRHQAIFAEIERRAAEEDAPVSAKIRFVLRKLWGHMLEPEWGHAFRLMLGEVSIEFPALFQTWAREGPIQGWSVVRDLIEQGARRGEFRPDADAEVSARLVVCGLMLQAALHIHFRTDELAPCDADRIFDSAVDLFLHGLSVAHRLPAEGDHRQTHQGGV